MKTITMHLNNGAEITMICESVADFLKIINENKWVHVQHKSKTFNIQVCNIAMFEVTEGDRND